MPGKLLTYEFISIKSWAATGEDEPGIMEGTAEAPHPIAAAHLPEAAAIFDAATALDTILDMVDPQRRRWWLSWCATCCSHVSCRHKSR
jgi:hypothetical protein